MVEDVPGHLEVGPVADVDDVPVAKGSDQGLLDVGKGLAMRPFDFHRALDSQHPLLDPAQFGPGHVAKHQRVADPQGLAVDGVPARTQRRIQETGTVAWNGVSQ